MISATEDPHDLLYWLEIKIIFDNRDPDDFLHWRFTLFLLLEIPMISDTGDPRDL
jgi:hypothetical protein